ncbi:3'-5' exoribonuclease [Actinocrinis puniceicyclus]|uniref:3'-5' exoribonuclease n=1 Tax=Actinocrinis puniceicyclus TaxID=977794 RepID=A0A8J7WNC6_9ACTN|nr:3'-5' exoribonuclease [Actinocrinis puniceicyclus]MBS2962610.1 3'-5' exoribonuclease [Actinocrinis puniceicyclus]
MRIFYDTEFIEDGRTIDLISIGIVDEDGREYYAVNTDMPWERILKNDWLVRNVVPSLPVRNRRILETYLKDSPNTHHRPGLDLLSLDDTDITVKPRNVIRNEVREYILATPSPQLWAWYGAYDHVALAQLFGPMIHLPEGIPMWTNDLKQQAMCLGNPTVPTQQAGEHNALEDARHNREIARFLDETARGQAANA